MTKDEFFSLCEYGEFHTVRIWSPMLPPRENRDYHGFIEESTFPHDMFRIRYSEHTEDAFHRDRFPYEYVMAVF